jgi:integrase/recombinase XerD
MADEPKLPAIQIAAIPRATRAQNDDQIIASSVASLRSSHSRRNFEVSARRFLAELPSGGIRAASIEDVRDALARITQGVASTTARQYVLRVKSLLGYAHRLGYSRFNAAAALKVKSDARSRGAALAKRIISEVEVGLLVRAARTKRDRVLLEVLYAGGLRVAEVVALSWADVLPRDKGQVQITVVGKGDVTRNILPPATVSRSLLSLRGDAGNADPVFASRKGGRRLTTRAVLGTVKRAAANAGIEAPVSPQWLRHAHGSLAIDRGATIPEVQATLGHANAATTSGYLHARPECSSGLKLDPGVFLR